MSRHDFEDIKPANLRVYHSTHFSVGMFTYFMIMSFASFPFINLVSMQNIRKNPFFTNRERYSDLNPFLNSPS